MSADDVEDLEGSSNFLSIIAILTSSVDDEEVAEACCDALLRLSTSVDKKELGTAAMDALTSCVIKMTEEDAASVVEVALSVMAKVASAVDVFGEVSLEALGKAMDTFDGTEPVIQEQGCLVICGIAEKKDAKVIAGLVDWGVMKRLEEADAKIVNVRNKKYVTEAMDLIAASN